MKQAIFALRHCLILISIIGTMYIAPISSYPIFTFLSLLYLGLDRLHPYLPRRVEWVLHLTKLLYIGWLSWQFGGVMFVLFFAAILTLYPISTLAFNLVLILLYVSGLNLSIYTESVIIIMLANIIFTVIVTALFLVRSASKQKEEIELLYDALRRNHYELDEARMRILEYAKKVEDVAQVEERNRISKDIHDDLGHKLIRTKMMMEAIIRILPTQAEKGMEMLSQARDHIADSMENLRVTVRKLKPEDTILKRYSLKQLIEDFGRDSGIQVEYIASGVPYPLYPSEEVALYRNAQEAMTNAVRHGQATEVLIHIQYYLDQVEMGISNNGHIPAKKLVKGLGFKGMEERMEMLGGSIEVITEGHFTVKTVLPHKSVMS